MSILRVAVAVLVFGVGCGVLPCTEVGCRSGVTFKLGATAAQFAPDQPVRVKACVAAQCTDDTLTLATGSNVALSADATLEFNATTGTLSFNPPGAGSAGPHAVTLELSRQGAVVASTGQTSVTFTSAMPNGALCAPTCWNASLDL